MAKFKKGDLVKNVEKEQTCDYYKFGDEGVVVYAGDELSNVRWKNGNQAFQSNKYLELIESAPEQSAEPTEGAELLRDIAKRDGTIFISTEDNKAYIRKDGEWIETDIHSAVADEWPKIEQDLGPQPNTLEWWRWHFAGQAVVAISGQGLSSESKAIVARQMADVIVRELLKHPFHK